MMRFEDVYDHAPRAYDAVVVVCAGELMFAADVPIHVTLAPHVV